MLQDMSSVHFQSVQEEEWGMFCDNRGRIIAQRVSLCKDIVGNEDYDFIDDEESTMDFFTSDQTWNLEGDTEEGIENFMSSKPGTVLVVATDDCDEMEQELSHQKEAFADNYEAEICESRTWFEETEDMKELISSQQNPQCKLLKTDESVTALLQSEAFPSSEIGDISSQTLGEYPCIKDDWFISKPLRKIHLIDDSTIINTNVVANNIRNFLHQHSIPLNKFAKHQLQRTQGTLSDLLNYPKRWNELSKKGKEIYVKFMEFLSADDLEKNVAKLQKKFVRGNIERLPDFILESLSDGLMPSDNDLLVASAKLSLDFSYIKQHCHEQLQDKSIECYERSIDDSRDTKNKEIFSDVNSEDESCNEPEAKKLKFVSTETQTDSLISNDEKLFNLKDSDRHICTVPDCGAILRNKQCLKNHLKCHNGNRLFQCSMCKRKCSTEHSLAIHLKTHSIPAKTSQRAKERLLSKLKQEGKQSYQTKFICGVCRKLFRSRNSLAKHLMFEHGVADQQLREGFICYVCSKSFKTVYSLEVHSRIHTNNRPFECEQCGKGFHTKANLERHIRSHKGEKPYSCHICQARFSASKSVTIHMRKHTGEKPYSCEVCKKSFAQAGALQAHTLIHKEEKKHLCELCGKSFTQKANLATHVKRHRGMKNHFCKTCGMSFLRKTDFERHLSKHRGDKKFQCEYCMKSFTRSIYLQEHLKRLQLPTVSQCQTCDKKFCDENSRKKHVKMHHGAPRDIIKHNNLVQVQADKFPNLETQGNTNTFFIAKTTMFDDDKHYLIATVSSVEENAECSSINDLNSDNVTLRDHGQSLVIAQPNDLSTQLSTTTGVPVILEGVRLSDQQFSIAGSRVSVMPQHMLFTSGSTILTSESSMPISLAPVDEENLKNTHNMVENSDPNMQSVIVESTEESIITRTSIADSNHGKHIKGSDDAKDCQVVFSHRSDDGIAMTMNDAQFCDGIDTSAAGSVPEDNNGSVLLRQVINENDQTVEDVKGQTYIIVDLELK